MPRRNKRMDTGYPNETGFINAHNAALTDTARVSVPLPTAIGNHNPINKTNQDRRNGL